MVAIAGLVLAALAGAWHIGLAYLGAWLDWARPASLKPFFETLTRFAQPGEIRALREAFDQWDIDRYAMNAWLAPALIVLTLAGGHHFLPVRRRRGRLAITVAVFGLAVLSALVVEPVGALFRGTGMTSSSTVAIFRWLDALVVTSAYLLIAALAALVAGRLLGQARFWSYRLPALVIHAGLIVALIAGSAATVFDSYAQRTVAYPLEFGTPIRLADGFTVTVDLEEDGLVPDGGRGSGFRALGTVGWQLEQDGEVVDAARGHTVYRDDRPPLAGEWGPRPANVRDPRLSLRPLRQRRYPDDPSVHPSRFKPRRPDLAAGRRVRGGWRSLGRNAAGDDGPGRAQGLSADELVLGRPRDDARGRRLAVRRRALYEAAIAEPGLCGCGLFGSPEDGRRTLGATLL